MTFKTTATILSLLAGIGVLAAAPALAQDTLEKVRETGSVTLGYRESSVPFSYVLESGKPIGFSMDLANAVVAEIRRGTGKVLEVHYVSVTSQNRIPLLLNGTVDLECGSTTNNSARGKDVAFAINHFYTGTRLLVKKSSGIKSYGDLAGKTIASTTGTTNAQVMRRFIQQKELDAQLLLGKDHADSMLLVDAGRAAAFAMDDILLFGQLATARNPDEWEVVGEPLQVEPYACMLRKNDPKFKALVDKVIAGLMTSGEFERLYSRWFMSPIPPNNITLKMPMGKELRDNLRLHSDKPAT